MNKLDILKEVTLNPYPYLANNKNDNDAETELEQLIGLENVKKQINRYKNYCLKAIKNGHPINLHMVFSGNPGTGKTTVARLVGQILYKYGILPTTNFVEGSRETLVGQYIGHTAIQTNSAVQQAMGGVLFIDEAYTLGYGGEKDFGKEAIDELIKSMEEYRGQFCLILAGYTDEMEKLFDINSGLKSRIQKNVLFDDYSKEELYKILDLLISKEGYKCEDAAKEMLVNHVYNAKYEKNYANAREIRIAFEQIAMIQAERTINNLLDKLIKVSDVEIYLKENESKNINVNIWCDKPKYTVIKNASNNPIVFDKEKMDDILESVVVLKVYENNSISESTAFIISSDGYAITCAHSIKNAVHLKARRRVKDRKGNTVDAYHSCEIAVCDDATDIAIIKIKGEGIRFSYLPLVDKNYFAKPLTEIVEIGYPFGASTFDNISIYKGFISSIQKVRGIYRYMVDINAYPGNSGSCLIDLKQGKVIGILQGAQCSDGLSINYAGLVNYVWSFLEKR